MKTKHYLIPFLAFLLFFTGCVSETPDKYVSFSLNVQEFIFIDEGIETANHVLDIHEQYDVPIDVFLTNASINIFEEEAPELLERLKDSDLAAVSYHVRPPLPYYTNYDFIGLESMSEDELYETISEYEEHVLDLNTGLPTDEPGGYEYLSELMGYAPKSVGMQLSPGLVGEVVSDVFYDKGALFRVVHGQSATPYTSGECLFVRGESTIETGIKPENIEIKLFQCLDKSPEQVIQDGFNAYAGDSPLFLTIKMHDNDFFSEKSSWTQVYLGEGRKGFGQEDFDYMDFADHSLLLSDDEAEEFWTLYEETVKYVSEGSYETINSFDLEEMF